MRNKRFAARPHGGRETKPLFGDTPGFRDSAAGCGLRQTQETSSDGRIRGREVGIHEAPPDFDRDVLALEPEKAVINADNPNLKQFIGRGGKLIMIEGWADATIGLQGAAEDPSNFTCKMPK